MKEYGYRNYGDVDEVALNILQKRYFKEGETKWEQVVKRVVDHVLKEDEDEIKEPIYSMMLNRYFIPNSPTLVNSGTKVGGLSACFVVDFPDSIEGIYKTKLDFALIAKKGGGCGTTLSKIRPEGSNVNGSSHGYAGGPVKFFDTICHDMTAMTQAGFREMAMMGVMSVYHPDIIKFIRAKTEEGKMHTTNISVMVDDEFMRRVENDETYLTYFDGQFYEQLKAREVFNLIVDGAWENGEPGLLFYEKVNDSPYKYSGQEIQACNPCVVGDTKILTVYNGPKPIKELTEDTLVYTWNPKTKLPEVSMMRNIGVTRKNSELVEVEFDSGLKVKCTPDHNFYSFRGNKIQAKDLTVGQSVRAFSLSIHRDGHMRAHGWVNGKASHQYVARMVWEFYNGKIENNLILHHMDFDKLNNHINNFMLVTNSEHNSIHYPQRRAAGFCKNHKVVSVKYLEEKEDVYNGTVDNTHTYIIADDKPIAGLFSGIVSANCGEQGLPANGVCNLGSIDICKFLDEENQIDYILLDLSVRIITRFLDKVITVNKFPTEDIAKWAEENRPIGIGIMGLADYFLRKGIVYGSELSLKETEAILGFIYNVAEDESITLGEEKGVPEACKNLPRPRRNITLLSIAPTGTIALLAGCSSGIEPIFSEITERKDKTGIYNIIHPAYKEPYFRCAVSSNGSQEVTWEEHVEMLNASQKFVDAGVSKTINFPNTAKRQTIYNAFMYAWKLPYIKGMTVYRNGSRVKEVLSPKNMKKDLCPVCGEELVRESGCKHCSVCDFSVCEIG